MDVWPRPFHQKIDATERQCFSVLLDVHQTNSRLELDAEFELQLKDGHQVLMWS